MYVEILKSGVIVIVFIVTPYCLTSHCRIFFSVRVGPLMLTISLSVVKCKISKLQQ